MKITNRKKALLGFAASTILVLSACGNNSVKNNETPEVYGPPEWVQPVPAYGVDYSDPEPGKLYNYPNQENYEEEFYITEIPDDIYESMEEIFNRKDCPVTRDDLRYLHILYKDVEDGSAEGEMLVHKSIAEDILKTMKILYLKGYLLDSVQLPDCYDENSIDTMMDQNNSYGFLYSPNIKDSKEIKHVLGFAIDINPGKNFYNYNNNAFIALSKPPISEDLCVQLFKDLGFEWGGDQRDLDLCMHFEIPDDVVEQWYPGVLGEK